jgi:hypothetical protein
MMVQSLIPSEIAGADEENVQHVIPSEIVEMNKLEEEYTTDSLDSASDSEHENDKLELDRPGTGLQPRFSRFYVCFDGCKRAIKNSCRPFIGEI